MRYCILLPMIVWLSLPWIAHTYENIALRKLAWQQNPLFKFFFGFHYIDGSASNAVDGLKEDLSAYGGQCTMSKDNKTTALWYVDLGSILSIHHITIYHRTDNVPWDQNNGFVRRFLGFSVYISNTKETEDFRICFKDNIFNVTTIPAVVTLNCTSQGRYVIFYNNRTSADLPPYYSKYAFNDLCEFEVYGCPDPGYYSENCSLSCSPHCVNSRCHVETGHCFECEDGYQGPTCEQSCENNTYGAGCLEDCGYCLGGQPCNPVTGSCYSGCAAGYYGNLCKTACQSVNDGPDCTLQCNSSCTNQRCDFVKEDCVEEFSQENGEYGGKRENRNMILFVATGGSVVVASVVTVVIAIVYRRRCGKKERTSDSNSQKSKKQQNNDGVSSLYDDNIQTSKCPEELSSQKSEYYCELVETQYNNSAADNVYEHV